MRLRVYRIRPVGICQRPERMFLGQDRRVALVLTLNLIATILNHLKHSKLEKVPMLKTRSLTLEMTSLTEFSPAVSQGLR